MEEENFRLFLNLVLNPNEWSLNNVKDMISKAVAYAELFQNKENFDKYYPIILEFIPTPEDFIDPPAFIIRTCLKRKTKSYDISIEVIQTFVHSVPNGEMIAKSIVSECIRESAINQILISHITPEFHQYIIASRLQSGAGVAHSIPEVQAAISAIKALVDSPQLFPSCQSLITQYFDAFEDNDIVSAALSSNEAMKSILSLLLPRILQNNIRSIQILQKIAADPKGNPARMLAHELKVRYNMPIILSQVPLE